MAVPTPSMHSCCLPLQRPLPLSHLPLSLFLQEQAVGPWYHPSAQETQPLFGEHKLAGDSRGWVKTHCCLTDAWHGGSSLLLRGLIPPEVDSVAVRWVSDRRVCGSLSSALCVCS
jgi:hypothetical protein